MKKSLVILFLFLILIIPGIIAPGTETTSEFTGSVESIALNGSGSQIYWKTYGKSPNGFKVVWSKNEGPTYPTREGDVYHYYDSPEKSSDVLEGFDGDGEYFVRVCEYLGGECGVYSNEIKVELIDIEKKETHEYEKEKENYEEKTECIGDDGTKGSCIGVGEEKKLGSVGEIKCESGCLLNEICYPLGYRRSGTYCSETLQFVDQTEDELVCSNNFECKSNLCVSDSCVSQGLIQKILSWFKNIFS